MLYDEQPVNEKARWIKTSGFRLWLFYISFILNNTSVRPSLFCSLSLCKLTTALLDPQEVSPASGCMIFIHLKHYHYGKVCCFHTQER